MAVSQEFVDFVIDQLELAGVVTPRRMFGGVGLYLSDVFFGLIADDVLFFKVDDASRRHYELAGAKPFSPYGKPSRGYYEVPPEILEDRDALAEWAAAAARVAADAARSKRWQIRKTGPKNRV